LKTCLAPPEILAPARQQRGSNTVMTLDANGAAPVVVEILDSHSPVPVIAGAERRCHALRLRQKRLNRGNGRIAASG
jgi:hypothetical protein